MREEINIRPFDSTALAIAQKQLASSDAELQYLGKEVIRMDREVKELIEKLRRIEQQQQRR